MPDPVLNWVAVAPRALLDANTIGPGKRVSMREQADASHEPQTFEVRLRTQSFVERMRLMAGWPPRSQVQFTTR